MGSIAGLVMSHVKLRQRRHERLRCMRVVTMSATDATRHVLCCSPVAVAPARRRKVRHPAGMRALVDVISASVLSAAEQKTNLKQMALQCRDIWYGHATQTVLA